MTTLDIYSKQKMRDQFQEKMVSLNKGFIKTLQNWVDGCPHYDLTPTVKSYLQHVKELDSTYYHNEEKDERKTLVNRVIAKAKRRATGDSPSLNTSRNTTIVASSSTPLSMNAPRMRLSDVSTIAPNDSIQATPTPDIPPGGSRKRAIRGGGPLGEPESVVFREEKTMDPKATLDTSKLMTGIPSFPKAGADFWGFGKKDSNGSTATTIETSPAQKTDLIKRISFTGDKIPEELVKSTESKEPQGSSLFAKTLTPPTNSIFLKAAAAKDESSPKAAFPNFLKKDESSSKPTFPNFSQTLGTPTFGDSQEGLKLGFGTSDSTKSIFGPAGTSELPNIFGQAGGSIPTLNSHDSTGLKLTFGPPLTANSQGEGQEDGEEGEYVPPKAEVVEGAEPDAFISVKCSVHKMVDKQYEKLGIGMLHMKEKDGKKSVLVRAATTVGTIWVNALVNKTMKVAKVDGKKLRIMCPTGDKEIAIYLMQFPTPTEADRVRETIEKESA